MDEKKMKQVQAKADSINASIEQAVIVLAPQHIGEAVLALAKRGDVVSLEAINAKLNELALMEATKNPLQNRYLVAASLLNERRGVD